MFLLISKIHQISSVICDYLKNNACNMYQIWPSNLFKYWSPPLARSKKRTSGPICAPSRCNSKVWFPSSLGINILQNSMQQNTTCEASATSIIWSPPLVRIKFVNRKRVARKYFKSTLCVVSRRFCSMFWMLNFNLFGVRPSHRNSQNTTYIMKNSFKLAFQKKLKMKRFKLLQEYVIMQKTRSQHASDVF